MGFARAHKEKLHFTRHMLYGVIVLCLWTIIVTVDTLDMQTSEEYKIHDNMGKKKTTDKGKSTPPAPPQQTQQMASAQSVWSNTGVIDNVNSGFETSNILSQANNVLYMQQPQVQSGVLQQQISASGHMPLHDVTNSQHTAGSTQSQTSASQYKYRPGYTATMNGNSACLSVGLNQNSAPPWLSQLFQNLDLRLQHIEGQLSNQDSRWQHIDNTLQSQSATLQNQNSRMLSIEQQLIEMRELKQTVTQVESSVQNMDKQIKKTSETMNDYQISINTYSELCDDMLQDQASKDSLVDELLTRVNKLEFEQEALKSKQVKAESNLVDLQCRSMQDNLIFTGISEVELKEGEKFENVEKTLNDFLQTEMNIDIPIAYHRVHRVGVYDKNEPGYSPRPIIAKFERFKDREYIRSEAPKTLRNKPYGVREQFPKVIEDKRKLLYPEMKKARRNENNKVRMVRDKLFINNKEFVADPKMTEDNISRHGRSEKPLNTNHRFQRNIHAQQSPSPNINSVGGTYQNGRVFYGKKKARQSQLPRAVESMKSVNFSVPLSNKFGVLAQNNEQCTPDKRSDMRSANMAGKHPASSPLDEGEIKKYREDSESDSDMNSSQIHIDMSPQTEPPRDDIIKRVVERESFIDPNSTNTAFETDKAALILEPTMSATAKPVQATLITCPITRTDTGNGCAISNSQQENESESEA